MSAKTISIKLNTLHCDDFKPLYTETHQHVNATTIEMKQTLCSNDVVYHFKSNFPLYGLYTVSQYVEMMGMSDKIITLVCDVHLDDIQNVINQLITMFDINEIKFNEVHV